MTLEIEMAKRLQAERTGRGIKLEQILALTGGKERSYRGYEKDATHLTVAALRKLESLGMDVFYIIFGDRLADKLTKDEQAILENYRAMSDRERAGLLGMIAGLRGLNNDVHVQGKVSQYAEGDVNSQYVEGNAFTVNWGKKPR